MWLQPFLFCLITHLSLLLSVTLSFFELGNEQQQEIDFLSHDIYYKQIKVATSLAIEDHLTENR